MPWTDPVDPEELTVITVAYAIANFLNPIRWLRVLTGGADPPGSGYMVTSDSTTTTSWKNGTSAIGSVLGYTPLNKAGDGMSGNLTLDNLIELRVKETGGTARLAIVMNGSNQMQVGQASNLLGLVGSSVLINGSTAWNAGNDGAGSGLDADTLDALESTAFARLAAASDFTTTPTINGVAILSLAGGIMSGNLILGNTIELRGRESGGTQRLLVVMNGSNQIQVGAATNLLGLVGSSILANGSTVWTAGNDGAGSGLDADTVDGKNPTATPAASALPLADGSGKLDSWITSTWLTECLKLAQAGGSQDITFTSGTVRIGENAGDLIGGGSAGLDGIAVAAGLVVSGVKSRIATGRDGQRAMLHALESPAPHFEDWGRAHLVDGEAVVPVPADFANYIAVDDYHVFLAAEGPAALYVAERTPERFTVRAVSADADAAFSWRLVARQVDFADEPRVRGYQYQDVGPDA